MLLPVIALAAVDPVPATPASETSIAAAVQVVRDYYAAIARHDYRAAFGIWHGKQSYAHFREGYAGTRAVRVSFMKPGDAGGAAGSSYIELPVRVDALLRSGAQQHFFGRFTLRRVNDVPGSTARQRRWHIESAHLMPVPEL